MYVLCSPLSISSCVVFSFLLCEWGTGFNVVFSFYFMLCSPFMLAFDLFSTYCSAIGDAVLAHFPRHQTNSRHFHPTASGWECNTCFAWLNCFSQKIYLHIIWFLSSGSRHLCLVCHQQWWQTPAKETVLEHLFTSRQSSSSATQSCVWQERFHTVHIVA